MHRDTIPLCPTLRDRVAGAIDYLLHEFPDLSTIYAIQWYEAFDAVAGGLETWTELGGGGTTDPRGVLSDELACDLLAMADESIAKLDRAYWTALGA